MQSSTLPHPGVHRGNGWFRSGFTVLILVLVYSLVIQPWHMRWGATDAEVAMPLPGDSLIPPDTVVSTRAITIQASPTDVWAWLVQLGQARGGFYSYTWLENLFAAQMHNADQIVPAWQHPQVGDPVTMMANPPPVSISEIVLLEPGRVLVLKGGWIFFLQPLDTQQTRLIVRYASFPVKGDWRTALYYYPLFEPAHFVMEVGMMLGIKQRAESTAQAQATLTLTLSPTRQEMRP
ncbi:MAG: hypothetical protein KF832_26730 [Caldilineaceae bacterium]|nr:hypothetical protein [Caldilineaceae bacterium]